MSEREIGIIRDPSGGEDFLVKTPLHVVLDADLQTKLFVAQSEFLEIEQFVSN